MSTTTTNKAYVKQTAGENSGTWGTGPLNGNFDIIDKNVGGSLALSGLTNSDVTLSTSQAENCFYVLTGTLSGNINIIWPQVGGFYFVDNQTTGAFTVTLKTSAVSGTTVTAVQENQTLVFTGGTNVKVAFSGPSGNFDVPGTLTADVVNAETRYQMDTVPLVIGHGQCQFQLSSTTVCKLMPYNGNNLAFPDGSVIQIPSAGISLSNGGLSNATLYYVYAVNDGTLEASVTGHTTDTSTGIEVKTGATTRVLVGMVYLIGGVFLDSVTNRLVASWFNRLPKSMRNSFTTNRTSASAVLAEINSEIRLNFLSWATCFSISFGGSVSNNSSSGSNGTVTQLYLDGATPYNFARSLVGGLNGYVVPPAMSDNVSPSEGFHYFTVFGANDNTGTVTWLSGCVLSGAVNL